MITGYSFHFSRKISMSLLFLSGTTIRKYILELLFLCFFFISIKFFTFSSTFSRLFTPVISSYFLLSELCMLITILSTLFAIISSAFPLSKRTPFVVKSMVFFLFLNFIYFIISMILGDSNGLVNKRRQNTAQEIIACICSA